MSKEDMETWEIQIPGSISVWVVDRRQGGYTVKRLNGSKGPRRITLSRDEREYNQELVPHENERLSPWTNGGLVQIVNGEKVGALTDESLMDYLQFETEDAFREAVETIGVELTLRRLLTKVAHDGRMWQVNILRDIIDERYRVGGTQPTVQEMFDEGEFGSRTRLS